MSSFITIERTEGLTRESEFRSRIVQREYERFLLEKGFSDQELKIARKIYRAAFFEAKKLIFDFVKNHLGLNIILSLPTHFYYMYGSRGSAAAVITKNSNISQFYLAIDPFDLYQYTDKLELIYLQSLKVFLHEILHFVSEQPLYFIEHDRTYIVTSGLETQEYRFYCDNDGKDRLWIRSIGMKINEAIVEYLASYLFTLKKFDGWTCVDFQRDVLPKDNEIYGTNVRKFIDLYDKIQFEKKKEYLKTLLMSLMDSYRFEGDFENQVDKGGNLIKDFLNCVFDTDVSIGEVGDLNFEKILVK